MNVERAEVEQNFKKLLKDKDEKKEQLEKENKNINDTYASIITKCQKKKKESSDIKKHQFE